MSSSLTKTKLLIRLIVALIVLAAVLLLCSLVGSERISLHGAIEDWLSGQMSTDRDIYFSIRLPRLLFASVVGAALACSGVVLQGLLRNPLADPYILGISSGAGLGAILAIITGLDWVLWGRSALPLFAFCGSLGTVWLVWGVARLTGRTHSTHLLLAGVVVNAFFSAVIMFLTSVAKAEQVYSTIFWLMGNIQPADNTVLIFSAVCVGAGLVALYLLSPHLNILTFGEHDARNIGISAGPVRIIAFAVAAFVTAIAVSLSGLIGFVGLVVPHTVRLVFGPDHRQLLPLSAVTGAIFLVVADTIARIVIAPAQLPVGVVTALVGGPFFLILLIRYARRVSWLAA